MIILQYSTQTEQVTDIQSRLEQLVVSHKVEETEGLTEPLLISDQEQYSGKDAISDFLEELDAELKQWYHCACG